MSADVPSSRAIVHEADVITGRAVAASTWLTAAHVSNWLRGCGDVIVPGYDPGLTIAAGASKSLVYHITPNGRAVRRVWQLRATGTGALTITAASASAVVRPLSGSTAEETAIEIVEDLAAKSGAAASLTLVVANGAGGGTITLTSVACYEAPRARLELDATDLGVDDLTSMVRAPIDARNNSSLGGIIAAHAEMVASAGTCRRVSYLSHARPAATADCWATSSTSYVPVLADGIALGRKRNAGATTAVITWWFYVSTQAGNTGTVRVTGPYGAVTAAIPDSASWSWVSVTQTYPCEDLTTSDGLPGAAWPQFVIEFKRASGAGTVYVASCCAEEN